MAFDKAYFSTVYTCGLGSIHHYRTSDAFTTVAASGYFTTYAYSVRYNLKQYDIIIVTATGGTSTGLFTVTSASGASPATTVYAAPGT